MTYKHERHEADSQRAGHICPAGIAIQGTQRLAEPGEGAAVRATAAGSTGTDTRSLAARFSLDELLTQRPRRSGLLPTLTSRINSAADELLEAIDTLCLAYGLGVDGKRK